MIQLGVWEYRREWVKGLSDRLFIEKNRQKEIMKLIKVKSLATPPLIPL